jgi:hypothetical protein
MPPSMILCRPFSVVLVGVTSFLSPAEHTSVLATMGLLTYFLL